MNLKLLILCINAVTATTSHNHHLLRQKPEHHDIAFRATKSDLTRLLKGEEEAPNQDLEALHVLRGSGRFLKDINCSAGGGTWTCDGDTEDCGNGQGQCREVCDEEKDCHDNGTCKKGKCDCYHGFEDKKDCSQQDVEYHVRVGFAPDAGVRGNREPSCNAALDSLLDDIASLNLRSTVPVDTKKSKKSKRTRNRHLKKNSSGDGPLQIPIIINADRSCTRTGLVTQALEQLASLDLIKDNSKGSRDI